MLVMERFKGLYSCETKILAVDRQWWEFAHLCITVMQPLTHSSATVSAERQILIETALFRRSDQQTVVCALLLSEIWYITMFGTCMVYFITPTVSTTWLGATSSSWYGPEGRLGMSDVILLPRISGLSLDSPFLFPLLFFLLSPLALSVLWFFC